MKHNYYIEGMSYRLRPVKIEDAKFIIDLRTSDEDRLRYVHRFTATLEQEKEWIDNYFEREGDYLFVIENRFSGENEGIISIYHQKGNKAEWGRWSTYKNSLASMESVYLLYRIGFEQIGLEELYCLTNADNIPVVSFHNSICEQYRGRLKDYYDIEGKLVDAEDHFCNLSHFYNVVAPKLMSTIKRIFKRQIRQYFGEFTFDHIGIATKNLLKEEAIYMIQGYEREGQMFEDENQGIRGLFMIQEGHPKIELLENLADSKTISSYLENNVKMYHRAYYVGDIEKAIECFKRNKARVVSPLKQSVYFSKRICFIMLPNMELIELLER